MRLSVRAARETRKLQREVDILKLLPPHPNLVRFVDSMEVGDWFFLVLEYVGGGDLFSALVRRRAQPGDRPRFQGVEAAHVFRQLVDGLAFLHSHDVIHRDLKLENVLVRGQSKRGPWTLCDVKIADFGLSKVVGAGLSVAQSTVGSPRYIAPEVLARGVHDFRADLWSLGVLAFALLSGRFPTEGAAALPQENMDASISSTLPENVDAAARGVLLGLLQVDREKRTPLCDLPKDPWITDAEQALEKLGTPTKRPRVGGQPSSPLVDGDDDSTCCVVTATAVPAVVPVSADADDFSCAVSLFTSGSVVAVDGYEVDPDLVSVEHETITVADANAVAGAGDSGKAA